MSDDELKRLLEANAAEVRRHFDVAMESTKHEIGLIAEKVTRLDEKLDQASATLERKIEQTAAETQAMIKFSHAELDRRMRALPPLAG